MDTVWGREPSTSKNNLLEVKVHVIKCKESLKAPSYPYLGLHMVKDLLRMGPAVDMLMRSLEPGRISPFSQFNT